MKKKIVSGLLLFIMASGLLTGCDIFNPTPEPTPVPTPVEQTGVIAEGNLVPADFVNLSFAIAGEVSEILVSEGDSVESGQVLARLSDSDSLQAQLDSAELAVLKAQQQLDDLQENADLVHARAQVDLIQAQQDLTAAEKAWDAVDTDGFQEELDDARIEMNDAQDDLDEAEDELADVEDLSEDNYSRQAAEDAVEEARQDYDEARWNFEALKYRRDLAEAQLGAAREAVSEATRRVDATADGPDPDDLALVESSLEQAETQQKAAETALEKVELTAPYAGRVVRIELTENTDTAPGTLAMVLIDDSEWVVETNDLTENEVVDVQLGQKVSLTFDAFPGQSFEGEVESISDYFQESFGDITYIVRIRLLETDADLRWGMTAEVEF
jgi:multidrug efflux pump subunit AcrA (membrane-fusion protein)